MGITGLGAGQLLIILVIVMLLFGTRKLRNLGGDMGNVVRGFKTELSGSSDSKERSAGSEVGHRE